ncbi:unnamed protein product, partial [Symbiodinium necroappetens]
MSYVVDRLDLRGWSTFANFAHAPTATPGTAGAEAAVKIVLDAILGDSLAAHEAALRRLHWEAWTLTAADLKRKVDGTDEAGPRKLPVAEIGARLQVLAPKISPLKLQGILEPSHASINLFAAMLDEGRLRYVEWAKLTTRDQEVLGATEDQLLKAWRPDKAGIVREHKDTPRLEANVATDLLVHHALRRRGVCFSVAELMSFEVHESLIQFLFDAYYKEPTEGYQRVTLAQLALCDREVHLRLSDQCRSGFTLGSDGFCHWIDICRSFCKCVALNNCSCLEPEALPALLPGTTDVRPKKRTPYMPAALKGGVPVDAEGAALCWNYNLGKCPVGEAPSVAGFGVDAAFEGGNIFVVQPEGPEVAFDAGRRVVLVAFCIDPVQQLKDDQRHVWKVPCLKWDVQQSPDVEFCLQRLREGAVSFLFVVPPGGSQSLSAPLNQAVLNFLVLLLATLAETCTSFCLCLPRASVFWKPVLAQTIGLKHFLTDVDLCQYGCDRRRATRLLHNVPALCDLARRCDGSHVHAPWAAKAPDSHQQRHLPTPFCDHVVQACLPLLSSSMLPSPLRPASAALQGSTKLHAVPAVVPEYKQVVRLRVSPDVPLPDEVPADGCPSLPGVPAGAVRLTGGRLNRDTTLLLKGV